MRNFKSITLGFFALSLMAFGCGDEDSDGTSGEIGTIVCEASTVSCTDQAIQELSLQSNKISAGDVVNTPNGDIFDSAIDATAGGFLDAADNPYLYLAFTDDGLIKVELDDEMALDSENWHIAAKRFVIRLNGGTSGPSCVGAALLAGETFENITEVPAGTTFQADSFYDSSCTFVDDGIGIGGPDTALNGWWEYPNGCLAMTGTPAIIQLNNGRHVRFTVLAYYGSGQAECDADGTMGTDSANLSVRWSFLD